MITDQPSMQQDQHESHNMPSSDYAGEVVPMGPYFQAATTANTQKRNNGETTPQDRPAPVIDIGPRIPGAR